MALVKYNNNSISDVTALAGIPAGALTHIKTLTASSSANLSFVDGSSDVVLDSTYPVYMFKFINIHPATDSVYLNVNFSVDTGSNYNVTKTTTVFIGFHKEDGSSSTLQYQTGDDLAQSTSDAILSVLVGNGDDESTSGELILFNPSSTTFVKHFISKSNDYERNNASSNTFAAGYGNTTSAIDGVRFKMSSGNIDSGTIKLYGIKDS